MLTRNEIVKATKLAKDRLTVATCTNANGAHKLPLFVIGKSKKSRAFKNINSSRLIYTGTKICLDGQHSV